MTNRAGARIGTVSRVSPAGDVYVELADVAPGFEFGPCLDTVGGLEKGDRVVAQALARDEDELVIVGILGGVSDTGGVTGAQLEAALVPYATDVDLTAMADAIADALDLKADDTDPRLTDARTPTAHEHAAADVTSGTLDLARVPILDLTKLPVAPSGNANATQIVRADDARLSNARTPTTHQHAAGDTTSGTFALARLPVAASGTSSATLIVRADDSRLSNARTPVAHSHAIADLTATGTRDATTYLRGDGTWATPAGSGGTMARMSAIQSAGSAVPSGAYTKIVNWSPDYMTGISHAAGVFTVLEAGYYVIGFRVGFGANAVNTHAATIWVNGTRVASALGHLTASVSHSIATDKELQLAANDAVEFRGLHNFGATLNTEATLGYTVCSIRRFA